MKELELFLNNQYGIEIMEIKSMATGVGGETFFVSSNHGKYVFKLADANNINRPEIEPKLCNFLYKNGIPVSVFKENKLENLVTQYKDGRYCHLQQYIEGTVFAMNMVSHWLMNQSALLLGDIHNKLQSYQALPMGIGKDFFDYMTIKNANHSYKKSLKIALEREEIEIIEDLEFRIRLTENFPNMKFDLEKLTYKNTHGDFTVNQIICDTKEIKAIIDWTSACRHPVIWELTRSFFYAEPSCVDGMLNEEKFREYVKAYCSMSPLTSYDIDNLFKLYYYQLAVCDYYSQYLNADNSKKDEFLIQAKFATKVLKNGKNYLR